MAEKETSSIEQTEKKEPLEGWQRWLEFVQIMAVLAIGCGLAVPFAFDFDPLWMGIGLPAFILIGVAFAFIASRLVKASPAEIETGQQFEITRTRLRTLASNGTPRDVLWALREMCDRQTRQWTGSEDEFRQTLYEKIGEKRGASYVGNLLPYLAVYVRDQQRPTDVSTQPQDPATKLIERKADASAAGASEANRPAAAPGKMPLGDVS
jgi:hypothetical protein